MLNQSRTDLGIPNRINLTSSRSSTRASENIIGSPIGLPPRVSPRPSAIRMPAPPRRSTTGTARRSGAAGRRRSRRGFERTPEPWGDLPCCGSSPQDAERSAGCRPERRESHRSGRLEHTFAACRPDAARAIARRPARSACRPSLGIPSQRSRRNARPPAADHADDERQQPARKSCWQAPGQGTCHLNASRHRR